MDQHLPTGLCGALYESDALQKVLEYVRRCCVLDWEKLVGELLLPNRLQPFADSQNMSNPNPFQRVFGHGCSNAPQIQAFVNLARDLILPLIFHRMLELYHHRHFRNQLLSDLLLRLHLNKFN